MARGRPSKATVYARLDATIAEFRPDPGAGAASATRSQPDVRLHAGYDAAIALTDGLAGGAAVLVVRIRDERAFYPDPSPTFARHPGRPDDTATGADSPTPVAGRPPTFRPSERGSVVGWVVGHVFPGSAAPTRSVPGLVVVWGGIGRSADPFGSGSGTRSSSAVRHRRGWVG